MKISIIYLSFCCLCISSCWQSGRGNAIADEKEKKEVVPVNMDKIKVSVMPLRYGDFNKEIISNGKLVAIRKADLKFRSSENVSTVFVKNGDRVSKDQVLAKLDEFTLMNNLKQMNDQFEKSRLSLQETLIGQGYNIKDSINIPEKIMKIARVKSGYDRSVADLEKAEYNLHAATLKAPFAGVVANLFSKENNLSNQSEKFCTIIDDSQFEAEFPVLESELISVRQGQDVKILPYSFSDLEVKGNIVKINPVVDKNGMVTTNAVCNNVDHKLFEGMNIKIILQERIPHQLVIPKQAVVLRSEKQVVFTYKSGQAKWIYVKTGTENINSFVVTEGLNEGDSIIFEGNLNLAHDAGVEINSN